MQFYKRQYKFTVLAIFFWLFCFLPLFTNAASLSVSPATGVYQSGTTFTVQVAVNTQGKKINAADGTLSFNPRELQVVSVTRGASIFNLWTSEPAFSNSAGTVVFSGGSPTGYTGSFGNVMTVTFRTIGSGTSRVSLTNGSVLAADGQGTNILTSMNGGNYTISAISNTPQPEVVVEYVPPPNTPSAPTVTSPTHPIETDWSTSTRAVFRWNLPNNITAVRTLLTEASSAVPTRVYEPPISTLSIDDLPEGTSYFYVQLRNGDGWGRVTRYRVNVDSKPLAPFNLSLATSSEPFKTILFSSSETTISPLQSYEVVIPGFPIVTGEIKSEQTTIDLPVLPPGDYTVLVTLINAVGATYTGSISFSIEAFAAPTVLQSPDRLNDKAIPVIKGQTEPGAVVTLSLKTGAQEPQLFTAQANEEGYFTIILENPLVRGVYSYVLSAVSPNGLQSEESNQYQFIVEEPGYITFGLMVVNVLSVLVTMVALLVLLFIIGLYGYRRLFILRRKVSKESTEVQTIVNRKFIELQYLLSTEADQVAKSRKAGSLTKAEDHLVSNMRVLLNEAEQQITKEITDVVKLVDKS